MFHVLQVGIFIRWNHLELLFLCINNGQYEPFYVVQPDSFHSNSTEMANLAIPVMVLEKANTIKEFFPFQKHDPSVACPGPAVCPSVSETLSCRVRVSNPLSIKRGEERYVHCIPRRMCL